MTMNSSLDETRRIGHGPLREYCAALLRAAGLCDADALLVASSLVEANLRGIDSHGVARLPHYLKRIAQGSINTRPALRLDNLGPACARLDGDHGLGQLVMWRAAREAVALATEAGAGWVSVCNSTHCGALDYFGLEIARAGMVGLVFTHVDPMVLPFGSRKPFCGTNPICITAPGQNGEALCLDMATSKIPWNRVTNASLEGTDLEPGLAVDARGHDTTDPDEVEALYPAGLYKGSGLGLMVDVLCAMLSDAPYGPDIPKMYGDLSQRRRLGGMVGAIDIKRFVPLERFHRRVSELLQRWNALPPAEPGGEVLYPGQPELITREQRLRDGIPLPAHVVHAFDELGVENRMERPLSALLLNAVQPEIV